MLNVGELILDPYGSECNARVDKEVELGRPRILVEKVILGISHAEIGARLLTRWMLPQDLLDMHGRLREELARAEDLLVA